MVERIPKLIQYTMAGRSNKLNISRCSPCGEVFVMLRMRYINLAETALTKCQLKRVITSTHSEIDQKLSDDWPLS